MGWWPFNRGSSNGSNEETKEMSPVAVESQDRPMFTESTAPNPNLPPTSRESTMSKEIKSYVSSLSLKDFYMSNLVSIPCFREAGLSGFTCFFVFSSVLYVYHRSLRKSVNWGFGGLLLGSIFGWEHCNNARRNSQMAVRLAQQRFEQKSSGKSD